MVIGRKQSDQVNNTANDSFQQGFAIEPQPPPGRRRIQIPKNLFHPKQPHPTRTATSQPNVSARLAGRRRILVTGGAGYDLRLTT